MAHSDVWLMTAEGDSRGLDAAELRRALALLIRDGEAHEVRALPSGRSRLVRGDQLDAATRAIGDLADERGLYMTVNPVRVDLGDKAARHKDIILRRMFLIDIDPIRPKDTCATDAEHEAARVVCQRIQDDLGQAGWPAPIVEDSGNGWYLFYPVELPQTPLSRQIIKGCLKALATRYNTDAVEIDPKVHDPNRIARLPGTWNRKGPDTPQRPHRLARLVSVPVAMVPVPIERLKSLAGIGGDPEPAAGGAATAGPWTMRADDREAAAYARAAMEREVGKVAVAGIRRNDQLYESALKLGGYIATGLLEEPECYRNLTNAAKACGLGEDGDPKEIDRAITNGFAAGKERPKPGPEPESNSRAQAKVTIGADGRRHYNFKLIVKGSQVEPKRVEWLWPDRVPIGFLTLLAGRTGVGKSFVTLDFAARLSAGMDLPDVPGGECLDPAGVLIISEDSQEYLLAPRLIELGADMDRIAFMTFEAMASFTLSDTAMLGDAYEEAGRPKLIVIDPPTNFLGARDEHRNAEIRGVLMGVSIWSMQHDLAVVMITHCNKGIKKDMAALDRIIGSVAWASTSRIAHILSPDPDDPSRSLFIPLKNNIGELARGLAYRVRKTESLAVVDWLGTVEMTGDQAIQGTARPRRVTAAEWLIQAFRRKREWESAELFNAAKQEANISRDAIFEAKRLLELPRARRLVAENGDVQWVWWVAPDWHHLRPETDTE